MLGCGENNCRTKQEVDPEDVRLHGLHLLERVCWECLDTSVNQTEMCVTAHINRNITVHLQE